LAEKAKSAAYLSRGRKKAKGNAQYQGKGTDMELKKGRGHFARVTCQSRFPMGGHCKEESRVAAK